MSGRGIVSSIARLGCRARRGVSTGRLVTPWSRADIEARQDGR
jgi:hypothetical protein